MTGALRSFTLASDAQIDKGIVSDLETAGGSLADLHAARLQTEQEKRDKAEEAGDELTTLKREADLLETKVRIKAAQTALAPGGTTPDQ